MMLMGVSIVASKSVLLFQHLLREYALKTMKGIALHVIRAFFKDRHARFDNIFRTQPLVS
jgi:hypothetical protein